MEAEESTSSESLTGFLAVFFAKDLMEEGEVVVVAAEEIMEVEGEEEEEDVDLVTLVERTGLHLSRRELVEILEVVRVGVETDRDGEEMEGERGATTVEEEEEGEGIT